MKILIFTDGSCEPNPGVGSWSFVINYKNKVIEKSGVESKSTNNRMEIVALLTALRELKFMNLHNAGFDIEVYVDSEYVAKGLCLWARKWRSKGWRLSKKRDLKNSDLWIDLWSEASTTPRLTVHVIKGHEGIYGNELVDKNCEIARFNYKGFVSERSLKYKESFYTKPLASFGFCVL